MVVTGALEDPKVERKVRSQQQRSYRACDAQYGVRTPSFRPRDRVHIRNQRMGAKMVSRYSQLVRIERQLRPATYFLSDGPRRNTTHLARVTGSLPLTGSDEVGVDLAPSRGEHTKRSSGSASGGRGIDKSDIEDDESTGAIDAYSNSDRELPPSSRGRRCWRPDWLGV